MVKLLVSSARGKDRSLVELRVMSGGKHSQTVECRMTVNMNIYFKIVLLKCFACFIPEVVM